MANRGQQQTLVRFSRDNGWSTLPALLCSLPRVQPQATAKLAGLARLRRMARITLLNQHRTDLRFEESQPLLIAADSQADSDSQSYRQAKTSRLLCRQNKTAWEWSVHRFAIGRWVGIAGIDAGKHTQACRSFFRLPSIRQTVDPQYTINPAASLKPALRPGGRPPPFGKRLEIASRIVCNSKVRESSGSVRQAHHEKGYSWQPG
jgi:hypothetical protein